MWNMYGVELRSFYIYYTEAFNQQSQVLHLIELLINHQINAHIISPCLLRTRTSAISVMPMEMILMIAWNLLLSSRAPLALTCKHFWNSITHCVLCASTGPAYDDTERLCLGILGELPSNCQEPMMSDPQLFQPERWGILRLIGERNISNA